MTKKELAIANHDKKYNCCQAVACSFCKEIGVDEETLFKAGEAFGLGMGGMEGTGFKNSDGQLNDPKTKAETYKLSREIVRRFEEKNGSLICRDLKGIDTGTVLRTCPGCIEDAVEIVQEVLGL